MSREAQMALGLVAWSLALVLLGAAVGWAVQ